MIKTRTQTPVRLSAGRCRPTAATGQQKSSEPATRMPRSLDREHPPASYKTGSKPFLSPGSRGRPSGSGTGSPGRAWPRLHLPRQVVWRSRSNRRRDCRLDATDLPHQSNAASYANRPSQRYGTMTEEASQLPEQLGPQPSCDPGLKRRPGTSRDAGRNRQQPLRHCRHSSRPSPPGRGRRGIRRNRQQAPLEMPPQARAKFARKRGARHPQKRSAACHRSVLAGRTKNRAESLSRPPAGSCRPSRENSHHPCFETLISGPSRPSVSRPPTCQRTCHVQVAAGAITCGPAIFQCPRHPASSPYLFSFPARTWVRACCPSGQGTGVALEAGLAAT